MPPEIPPMLRFVPLLKQVGTLRLLQVWTQTAVDAFSESNPRRSVNGTLYCVNNYFCLNALTRNNMFQHSVEQISFIAVSYILASQQSFGVHSLHKKCGAGCVHPGSILPLTTRIQPYPMPTGQETVSSTLTTQGLASSMPLNFSTSFPQCGCGFCSPHTGNATQALGAGLTLGCLISWLSVLKNPWTHVDATKYRKHWRFPSILERSFSARAVRS